MNDTQNTSPQPQMPIKTEVTASVGLSVQDPTGSWEKDNWQISCTFNGYPTPEAMQYWGGQIMQDCTDFANEQIQKLAQRFIDEVNARKGLPK